MVARLRAVGSTLSGVLRMSATSSTILSKYSITPPIAGRTYGFEMFHIIMLFVSRLFGNDRKRDFIVMSYLDRHGVQLDARARNLVFNEK